MCSLQLTGGNEGGVTMIIIDCDVCREDNSSYVDFADRDLQCRTLLTVVALID